MVRVPFLSENVNVWALQMVDLDDVDSEALGDSPSGREALSRGVMETLADEA
jgi:hypothetical protein